MTHSKNFQVKLKTNGRKEEHNIHFEGYRIRKYVENERKKKKKS